MRPITSPCKPESSPIQHAEIPPPHTGRAAQETSTPPPAEASAAFPLVADFADASLRRLRHALQAKVSWRAIHLSPSPLPAPPFQFRAFLLTLVFSLLPNRCLAAAANRIRPLSRAFCDAPASRADAAPGGVPGSQVLPQTLPHRVSPSLFLSAFGLCLRV